MKTIKSLFPAVIITVVLISYAFLPGIGEQFKNVCSNQSDTSANYLDGTYYGKSRAGYTSENFWGHSRITVSGGSFTSFYFCARDSDTHEVVDSSYGETHYGSQPEYLQQTYFETYQINLYTAQLLETQNLDEVDGVTDATWSYDLMMASLDEALKDAKKTSAIDNINENGPASVVFSPNPFFMSVDIEYRIPENSYVNVCVYDTKGRLIKKLVDEKQYSGTYTIRWSDCPASGLYFCRIRADQNIICKRLIKY